MQSISQENRKTPEFFNMSYFIVMSFHSINSLNFMRYYITAINSQYLLLFTHIFNLIRNLSSLKFWSVPPVIIFLFENFLYFALIWEKKKKKPCFLPYSSRLAAMFFNQFENIVSLLYLYLCREVSKNQKSDLLLLFWRKSVLFPQLF